MQMRGSPMRKAVELQIPVEMIALTISQSRLPVENSQGNVWQYNASVSECASRA